MFNDHFGVKHIHCYLHLCKDARAILIRTLEKELGHIISLKCGSVILLKNGTKIVMRTWLGPRMYYSSIVFAWHLSEPRKLMRIWCNFRYLLSSNLSIIFAFSNLWNTSILFRFDYFFCVVTKRFLDISKLLGKRALSSTQSYITWYLIFESILILVLK